jgi:predicted alpha/beta-hydrolase family hydrolase
VRENAGHEVIICLSFPFTGGRPQQLDRHHVTHVVVILVLWENAGHEVIICLSFPFTGGRRSSSIAATSLTLL